MSFHEQANDETNRLWAYREGENAFDNDQRKWVYARDNREHVLRLEEAVRDLEELPKGTPIPLADLDALLTRTDGERARLRKENDYLRGVVGNGNYACVYCGLSREDMAKCPSGFPGCARADDILCAPPCAGCIRLAEVRRETLAKARDWLQENNGALAAYAEEMYRALAPKVTEDT
jgi:hypothetical protein